MKRTIFCLAGNSPALNHAASDLIARGIPVVDHPAPDVTHLLLPVPSFESDGRIRGGGMLEHVLAELSDRVTILGGNLDHPILDCYQTIDLLQDPFYLAENAAITADCAIRVAGRHLTTVFKDCPVLVLGWGRIGKCLATALKALEANVTVAARKESDRAMLRALGFRTENMNSLSCILGRYRIIFNTVPAPLLNEDQLLNCKDNCIKIDLASKAGIWGERVIWARGLPGKDAPEASGLLIARTVIRHIVGRENPL